MEYRALGRSGESVSVIGVGTWAAGGRNWGGTDDLKTTEAFFRAIDLGINFFDTAPAYGLGHSESVLGEVLKFKRDRVFLATKFGIVWDQDEEVKITNNLRPQSIRDECDQSLARLQTDRIDLYQCHWPLQGDAMTRTVAEDMMDTLFKLRDLGKIRYFGVSNFTVEQIEWCGGGRALISVQPPLSILRPGSMEKVIPYSREQKIGVITYSPLFRGLLTGKYKGTETFPEGDSRREHPDYSGEVFKGICETVQKLQTAANAHQTTIAGVSLNWVLSAPGVTVALAGTRSKDQIEDAVRGQGWKLSPEECCQISGMFKDYAKIL